MTDIRHVDFYPNDWIAAIATLDVVDVGIFATAEAMIYSHGGPIQKADLKRFVRCHGKAFENALARLVASGRLILNGSEISSKRCLKELEKARERIAKWSENGSKGGRPSKENNDLPKPNGSYARAQPSASQESKNLESSPASQDSSPACAREGRPEEAGLAGLADFKISDEWKREAADARDAAGQPAVDMDAEARKAEARWEREPPRNPHRAWLGWASTARPDKTNVIDLHPRRSPEEIEAERQAARLIARAAWGIPLDARA